MNTPNPNVKPPIPWAALSGKAAVVSAAGLGLIYFVSLSPGWLLAALFVFGVVAGGWAARQAWLAGMIVGLPMTVAQITRWSALERAAGSDLYWLLVPMVAIPATGIAIAGGLTGAWVRNTR